jgi:hypothetical protein
MKKVFDPETGKPKWVEDDSFGRTTEAPINHDKSDGKHAQCFECNKPITGYQITVKGHNYHSDCFACYKCNKQFEMNRLRYCWEEGKPWCGNCINAKDRAAGHTKDREFNDAKSHDTDISRAITQMASLGDKPVYGGGGSTPLADVVTGKVGNKTSSDKTFCANCGLVVSGVSISTSKGPYHEKCFVCLSCKQQIGSDEGHMFVGDKPHHADCGRKVTSGVCPRCNGAATGKTYNVKGVKYHATCFVCVACKKDLSAGYTPGDPNYCSQLCKTGSGPSSMAPTPTVTTTYVKQKPVVSQEAIQGPFTGQRCCPSCGHFNPGSAKFCSECGGTF